MNQELKTKWVEALRSGRYPKGESQLRCGSQFCALGVLCDVSGVGRWETTPYDDRDYYVPNGRESEKDATTLPTPVTEVALLAPRDEEAVFNMNDDGATFPEIADWIEQNL